MITTRERGNSLQNGKLTSSARRVGRGMYVCRCFECGEPGRKRRDRPKITQAGTRREPLLINLDHELAQEEGDPLQPELANKLGMPGSLKLEDEYFS